MKLRATPAVARWLVLGALILLLAAALAIVMGARRGDAGPASAATASDPLALALDNSLQRATRRAAAPALAIRPLTIVADDAGLAAISHELCSQAAEGLARLGEMQVTACESTRVALAAGLDDLSLARLLAVDYMVKGRAERQPDGRLRIEVGLHEVSTGRVRWRDDATRTSAELAALPQQIVARTRASLGLGGATSAGSDAALPAPAYETYMRAVQVAARGSPADQREALRLMDEVLALEPHYLPARVSQLSLRGTALRFPTAAEREDAAGQREAQRRLIDDTAALGAEIVAGAPQDPRGRVLLANIAVQQRRWREGFEHLDVLAAQSTRAAQQLRTAAHLHAMAGYLRTALALALEAGRLDPLNAVNHQALALFHGLLGDTAAMRESARIAQELGDRMAVVYNGIAALREGDWALAEAATVEGLRGAGVDAGWVAAFVRGAADPAARETAAAQIEALPAPLQHGMAQFHWYLGWLGDTPRTLRAVHINLHGRPVSAWLSNLWWPELAHLRQAPEFAAVLDDAGLPALWQQRGAPDRCTARAGGGWACR